MSTPRAYVADGLVILGTVVMVLAVAAVLRAPGVLAKVHAGSKALALGHVLLLLGIAVSGGPELAAHSLVVAVTLVLTVPISAHALTSAQSRQDARDSDVR